ncbi:hypothetical protein RCL1_008310 [Eukaryota sp. TZLM3-RCL]
MIALKSVAFVLLVCAALATLPIPLGDGVPVPLQSADSKMWNRYVVTASASKNNALIYVDCQGDTNFYVAYKASTLPPDEDSSTSQWDNYQYMRCSAQNHYRVYAPADYVGPLYIGVKSYSSSSTIAYTITGFQPDKIGPIQDDTNLEFDMTESTKVTTSFYMTPTSGETCGQVIISANQTMLSNTYLRVRIINPKQYSSQSLYYSYATNLLPYDSSSDGGFTYSSISSDKSQDFVVYPPSNPDLPFNMGFCLYSSSTSSPAFFKMIIEQVAYAEDLIDVVNGDEYTEKTYKFTTDYQADSKQAPSIMIPFDVLPDTHRILFYFLVKDDLQISMDMSSHSEFLFIPSTCNTRKDESPDYIEKQSSSSASYNCAVSYVSKYRVVMFNPEVDRHFIRLWPYNSAASGEVEVTIAYKVVNVTRRIVSAPMTHLDIATFKITVTGLSKSTDVCYKIVSEDYQGLLSCSSRFSDYSTSVTTSNNEVVFESNSKTSGSKNAAPFGKGQRVLFGIEGLADQSLHVTFDFLFCAEGKAGRNCEEPLYTVERSFEYEITEEETSERIHYQLPALSPKTECDLILSVENENGKVNHAYRDASPYVYKYDAQTPYIYTVDGVVSKTVKRNDYEFVINPFVTLLRKGVASTSGKFDMTLTCDCGAGTVDDNGICICPEGTMGSKCQYPVYDSFDDFSNDNVLEPKQTKIVRLKIAPNTAALSWSVQANSSLSSSLRHLVVKSINEVEFDKDDVDSLVLSEFTIPNSKSRQLSLLLPSDSYYFFIFTCTDSTKQCQASSSGGKPLKKCPNNCNGRGICEDGVCLCAGGWIGEDCSKTCGKGKYGEKNVCHYCPKGTYNDLDVIGACKPCNNGYSCEKEGAITRDKCSKGHYSPNDGKPHSHCFSCEAATYSDIEGASSCKKCNNGKYCEDTGTIEPSLCGKGTYTPLDGYGYSECVDCAAGTYNPSLGQNTCKRCNTGYNCPTPAQETQTPCGKGTFTPEDNKAYSECLLCDAGFSSFEANTSCYPCHSGTFCADVGTPDPEPCSPGFFTPVPELDVDENMFNFTECIACDVDFFVPDQGAVKCSPCSHWFITKEMIGQAKCVIDPMFLIKVGGILFIVIILVPIVLCIAKKKKVSVSVDDSLSLTTNLIQNEDFEV